MDLETLYRNEAGRVRASLIRLLGGFEPAEEALHDAFMAAAEQWPRQGVPRNPRAWLVSAGRFKAIDRLRRRARFDAAAPELQRSLEGEMTAPVQDAAEMAAEIADDGLRLIFTCCHPILPPDMQVALTLREICALRTEEIAHAFLVAPTTVAQRIVRAKHRIRGARLVYEVPGRAELPERLGIVLKIVYLVFNEGYSASSGASVTRAELAGEAIRLGRLLMELMPGPEVVGLLAMMLLQHSRRAARMSETGDLILLADQNRSLWDWHAIEEGLALAEEAERAGSPGPYVLQARIAAVHARARRPDDTDWSEIVRLYDELLAPGAAPVIALNRAVALAERDGAAAGLSALDGILTTGALADYHLAHAARADLLRRLGRSDEARAAYGRALALALQGPERAFLEGRLRELD